MAAPMAMRVRLMSFIRCASSSHFCKSDASTSFVNYSTDIWKHKHCRFYCQSTTVSKSMDPELATTTQGKVQRISKAMQAYLERANQHDALIAEHTAEYELGKKHLAKMMDVDPDNFSQEDIDKAIEYLLPSGLFDKKARPKMKHPEDVFPKKKDAEFDVTGRPFHYLFYTGLPNYYDLMHTISVKLEALENKEAAMYAKKLEPTALDQFKISGSEWLSCKALESLLLEKINEKLHRRFIILMERLINHPLSNKEKDFIMEYRVKLVASTQLLSIPEVCEDQETGRKYAEATGKRKHWAAKVKVWQPGTGLVNINGQSLSYFSDMKEREQLMTPLAFVGKLGHVDFEGTVDDQGGIAGQAGALRLAISLCLAAFEDEDMREKMRQAGLLTMDPRVKERKKPGQRRARKKKTWKKR